MCKEFQFEVFTTEVRRGYYSVEADNEREATEKLRAIVSESPERFDNDSVVNFNIDVRSVGDRIPVTKLDD